MCLTYSVLTYEYEYGTSDAFYFLQVLFFLMKMVSPCEVLIIFGGIEHQIQKNILHHFHHYSFFLKPSLN